MKTDRKDFMSFDQKAKVAEMFGQAPKRTHENMIAATGVARPGKTAQDKARPPKDKARPPKE